MRKIIHLFVALFASNLLLFAQTKPSDNFLAGKPGFYVLSSELLREMKTSEKPDVTKIYGKIKIVDSFPDYKVKVVSNFADLHVKVVSSFADEPGKWQMVESFPDFKIQFVESFPDFTIKFVESFPGKP
ncbi:MAG: hypothetical protein Q4G48_00360 [Bacteroidia bacterium]|nr:hypothetical protein [Bacteroidia bacterium]